MNTSLNHNHKGFTLIETLFAVLIFSASLISLMTIAGRGIAAATTAREQTVAHYLAQEGIEVVRNIRDSAFLGGGWSDGFNQCTETDPCHLVYGTTSSTPPELVSCTVTGTNGCPIYESMGAFVDGGDLSPYTRKIYTIPSGDPNPVTGSISEYKIISEIRWTSKNVNRLVTLQTLVKEWK